MPEKNRRVQLAFYVICIFVYWASLYFYVPTLSTYAEDVTHDLSVVGVIVSMYGLWQAVARYPLGILSDLVGRRKPFILIGLLLGAVGALVMLKAQGAPGLIIGRGITGLAAATWVLLMVGFSSLLPPESAVQAAAVLNIVNAFGRTLATGITGMLNQAGGYGLAFKVAIGASILSALLFLPVRDPVRPRRKPDLRALARLSTRPDVLIPSLVAAIVQFASWAAVFGFLPIIARDFGANDNQLSLMSMLNILVGIGGNFLITLLVRRTGNKPVLLVGISLIGAAMAMIAVADALWMLFAATMILGLGWVSISTLMGLSIRYVREEDRSTAMGLHQSIYGFGMFFGPYLSGYMAEAWGVQSMFWVLMAVVLLGGYAGTFVISRVERRLVAQHGR
jgi:predicted MFS family arabinose efflux permease